jgi:hypothetical protein
LTILCFSIGLSMYVCREIMKYELFSRVIVIDDIYHRGLS